MCKTFWDSRFVCNIIYEQNYLERQQLIRLTIYYTYLRKFRSLYFEIMKSRTSWLLLKELYLTLVSTTFGCCLSCYKSLQHSSTLPSKHRFRRLPNYKLQLHQCLLLMHNVSLPGAIDRPLKDLIVVINKTGCQSILNTYKWIPWDSVAQPSCKNFQAYEIHHCCTQLQCFGFYWIFDMHHSCRHLLGLFEMSIDSILLNILKLITQNLENKHHFGSGHLK